MTDWITDRRPFPVDGDADGEVRIKRFPDNDHDGAFLHHSLVPSGMAWQHWHGWTFPEIKKGQTWRREDGQEVTVQGNGGGNIPWFIGGYWYDDKGRAPGAKLGKDLAKLISEAPEPEPEPEPEPARFPQPGETWKRSNGEIVKVNVNRYGRSGPLPIESAEIGRENDYHAHRADGTSCINNSGCDLTELVSEAPPEGQESESPVKFVVGQQWRSRGGRVCTILKVRDHESHSHPIQSDLYGSHWHFPNGNSCLGNGNHEDDLIELILEPETETKKETEAAPQAAKAPRLFKDFFTSHDQNWQDGLATDGTAWTRHFTAEEGWSQWEQVAPLPQD